MQYTTTMSSKGQIVIPKPIREKLDLKPSDRLSVTTEGEKITVEQVTPLNEMMGMFKPKKKITKKDIKEAYRQHVEEKFSDR